MRTTFFRCSKQKDSRTMGAEHRTATNNGETAANNQGNKKESARAKKYVAQKKSVPMARLELATLSLEG
jgi:hypothetical protein